MTSTHRDGVLWLLAQVGERCQAVLEERVKGFHCRLIQAHEIWTFCPRREQRLTEDEEGNPEVGDQYVFIAHDPESKLIPTFLVGKRDTATASRFVRALRACLKGNGRIQLTTDGLRAYLTAVEEALGFDADNAQFVRLYGTELAGDGRYAPPRVTETASMPISGNQDPARTCTSHVERQNPTIRKMCLRFTRLTNAFSKKIAHLKAALALHFAYYNFCRIHQTLRVTPEMAAGVTDRVWEVADLLGE